MANTYTLTGDGATGIVTGPKQYAAIANLPLEVCLGRKGIANRPVALRLEDFVENLQTAPTPDKVDWYTKASASIARMYRNNVQGCCVISGKAHNLGVWSANDHDSANGQTILATDAEIDQQYRAICGPGDNGCNIASVLDHMVRVGFQANGQKYKIRGYCAFDWRSKELTKAAIALGGALSIGFNLPGAWMNSSVWDNGPTNWVGGHDVSPVGYGTPEAINTTKDGVVVSSWGRLYLFTWEAWCSTRYVDECYFMVPEGLWTGLDGLNPLGVDVEGLLKAMDAIKGGQVPPLPDPQPIDPTPDPLPVSGFSFPVPGGHVSGNYASKVVTIPPGWTSRTQ